MTNRKPWHQGGYHVAARRVREAAWANPDTRCWKCNRTITEVMHRNGKPGHWTAGHINDGEVNGSLLAECSVCAARTGATRGNQLREPRSEDPYQ